MAFGLKSAVIRPIAVMMACATLGQIGTAFPDLETSAVRSFSETRDIVKSFEVSAANSTSFRQVFQLYPPVLTAGPSGSLEITDGFGTASVAIVNHNLPTCQQTLVAYSFANSYGVPFVGSYSPPACDFNRVTWKLNVVSAGRQFDRLGIVYLGDIEVFRTSTAEPTAAGIEWNYLKDMTSYLSLFKTEQKIIFDLGNLIDNTYTAAFNVTLTASYFEALDTIVPADIVLPISAQQSGADAPSVFTVPPDTASTLLTLPRNARQAVATIAATGQSQEEFWWSNVLQSEINTFPAAGTLYGYSPFREVQLFIDGTLAGVVWPFPIIFTGGVVPGLWRPIVGIDAFDLREDEIDITPWLPLLCDGNGHNFTIRVSGLNDTGNGAASLSEITDTYWLVTGKIFVWLDAANHSTTGSVTVQDVPAPSFEVTSSISTMGDGTNATLLYQVAAQRQLTFSSVLQTSRGPKNVSWHQEYSYTSLGNYTDGSNVEVNVQNTKGVDVSSSGYSRRIDYELYAFSAYTTNGDNYSIEATVDRVKNVDAVGSAVFPTGLESFSAVQNLQAQYPSFQGASLYTWQNGTATYIANSTSLASFSFGTTEQDLVFSGIKTGGQGPRSFPTIAGSTELFHHRAKAVNGTVVEDDETLIGQDVPHPPQAAGSTHGFGVPGVNSMLGHGPGGKDEQAVLQPPDSR